MTQAFFILVKVNENKLTQRAGGHIKATIVELNRAVNAQDDCSCKVYMAKNPATLDEWEKELKKVNNL